MTPNATSMPLLGAEQKGAAAAVADEDKTHQGPRTNQRRGAVLLPGGVDAARAERHRTRGQRGRQKAPRKIATAIRLSPEVTDFFRSGGAGWQTRIDEVLREYVKAHTMGISR